MITAENAKENRILSFLNRLSLICHTALTVLFIAVLLYFASTLAGLTTLHFSPPWILLPAFGIGIAELLAAMVSNRILAKNAGAMTLTPRGQGELLVKRKLAWMYAPDKLEHWLNEMEGQGYSLQRVGKRGGTTLPGKTGKNSITAWTIS